MMTHQELSQEEQFQSNLQSLFESAIENEDALNKIRTKAWDHFLELGLPTRQKEVYQYIRLRNLFSQTYLTAPQTTVSFEQVQTHVYPECQGAFLTFINGYFHKELSCLQALPEKVVVSELSSASRTYSAFLNNHWAKTMKEEIDPFAALNAAIHRQGLFIYVPPGTAVETPIQFVHIIDNPNTEDTVLIVPRIQVFAGKSAEFHIVSSLDHCSENSYGMNQVIDFSIDENAQVKYTQTVLDQHASNWHFDAVRATLKRNSKFQSINVTDGTYSYRNDYHIILAQEGAEAELDGATILFDKRESHANVFMDHQAPHCKSRQLFKTVLRDVSRSSFEGKIFVRQIAQQTDAFQLNNNLLLSEKTHADSKPNLEIFADDVKASHGSTIGRLNQDQLFYLKSRGFSDKDAKNLLIYGYCKEVIDRITIPSLFEKLKVRVENYIG